MPHTRNNGRSTDGRFGKGNAGRPRGARNKATQAIEALLEGEAEGLTRKAVELALGGDVTALKLCLDRIAPPRKDRPIRIDLPQASNAQETVALSEAILRQVAQGELTPLEAQPVMAMVEQYRRIMETAELEHRISELERASR